MLLATTSLTAGAADSLLTADQLPSLIECKKSFREYSAAMYALPSSDAELKRAGWKKLPSKNPMAYEYRLNKPITVFGQKTQHIALTSIGLYAVLDKDFGHWSDRLELEIERNGPASFYATRVLSKKDGVIQMLAATGLGQYPSWNLVGCEYLS